ncbi:MAG: SMC-Scp complex subunit ScpB [Lachnospiraceae bacterium]|jgi:segregation and condensation protein B|nr:SMC-Scp complex subunit ScpB [Lachnospiraceae bacterium]
MELKKAIAAAEAILFAMGSSVRIQDLSKALEMSEKDTVRVIAGLQAKYEQQDSGITVTQLEDAVQLCTKSEYYEYLIRIASVPKKIVLSDALLESLAIVAYKQPVTKAEIAAIRGVNCDSSIDRLLSFGLIEELGRKDAPGRPILFGTTEQFLRSFGVKSIEELPSLNDQQIREFKEEAEEEASANLSKITM